MNAVYVASVSKEIHTFAYTRDYILERNRIGVIHVERISLAVEACSLTKLRVLVLPS